MMHTKRGALVWALVLLAAVATATPVAAKGKPAGPPGGGGLEGGTTCAESLNTDYKGVSVDGHIEIVDQAAGIYCVDVSNVQAGDWQVEFKVARGTLKSLILQVRDSVAPSDLCADVRFVPARFGPSDGVQTATIAVDKGDWLNACGTQFAELIEGVDHWDEDRAFLHPLAFLVWAGGNKDLKIEFVRVDVPTGP